MRLMVVEGGRLHLVGDEMCFLLHGGVEASLLVYWSWVCGDGANKLYSTMRRLMESHMCLQKIERRLLLIEDESGGGRIGLEECTARGVRHCGERGAKAGSWLLGTEG